MPPPQQTDTAEYRMLIAAVKQARLYAEMAVQADMKHDYSNAVGNYRAAINSLRGEEVHVPPEDLDAYRERVCAFFVGLPPPLFFFICARGVWISQCFF